MIPSDSSHFKKYQILYKELEEYNPELIDKDIIVSISKSDLLDDELKKSQPNFLLKPLFFSGVTRRFEVELKRCDLEGNYTDKKHKAFIFERFSFIFLKRLSLPNYSRHSLAKSIYTFLKISENFH